MRHWVLRCTTSISHKNPWKDDSPGNTRSNGCPMVSKVIGDLVHPPYFPCENRDMGEELENKSNKTSGRSLNVPCAPSGKRGVSFEAAMW